MVLSLSGCPTRAVRGQGRPNRHTPSHPLDVNRSRHRVAQAFGGARVDGLCSLPIRAEVGSGDHALPRSPRRQLVRDGAAKDRRPSFGMLPGPFTPK